MREYIFKFTKSLLQVLGIAYLIHTISKITKIPTGYLLIAANVIPVIGVLFWGWNPYDIVLLYWSENIVIGFYTIFKIILAQGVPDSYTNETANKRSVNIFAKTSMALFFLVHYGIFTAVHGIFVIGFMMESSTFTSQQQFVGPIIFFIALLISHGVSFFFNFLGRGEYLVESAPVYFAKPYGRVIITHLTILFGAFLATAAGIPAGIVVVFILLKIVADLSMHLNSHTKAAQSVQTIH